MWVFSFFNKLSFQCLHPLLPDSGCDQTLQSGVFKTGGRRIIRAPRLRVLLSPDSLENGNVWDNVALQDSAGNYFPHGGSVAGVLTVPPVLPLKMRNITAEEEQRDLSGF